MSSRLAARYAQTDFAPDLWLWGQRGNDYQRHRRRVNRFLPLAGRDLLIAGCGTGADVASWVAMHPRSVLAIDWFDYTRAWQKWRSQFQRTAPDVDVRFAQGDLEDLGDLPERSFDVFGSDAVFEHVRNLSRVLAQAFRVLRDGGLLYATFGPLWYAWGGDHIFG
jgi:SAM-dependent methyltransferase